MSPSGRLRVACRLRLMRDRPRQSIMHASGGGGRKVGGNRARPDGVLAVPWGLGPKGAGFGHDRKQGRDERGYGVERRGLALPF
nr:hypothetical protein RVX_0254 [Nitratidesulfovibrio sp. HK-II]